MRLRLINTLRPGQDGRHFAEDIFTCIFINENCCVLIKFSLKYVHMDPIDNNPALVQIMAWRRSGDKPLSEPMMISLSTHICVTRPQWVNHRQSSNSNCRLGLCISLWFWYPGTLHTGEWNPGGFSSGFMRSYRQFGKLYWGDEILRYFVIFCYSGMISTLKVIF